MTRFNEGIDVCVPALTPLHGSFIKHLHERIPNIHHILRSAVKPLGKARQQLIERVDTEWFAFIDTDVILSKQWWDDVTSRITEKTGAVEGRIAMLTPNGELEVCNAVMDAFSYWIARLRGRQVPIARFGRAFTGATLIRKQSVVGIQIPSIAVCEDEYIRRYVERNGYEWLRTPHAIALHRRRNLNMKEVYVEGYQSHQLGFSDFQHELRRFLFLLPIKLFFAIYHTKQLSVGLLVLKVQKTHFAGVLASHVRSAR